MILNLIRSAFALLLSAKGASGFGESPRFLFVSSPSSGTIGYVRLPGQGTSESYIVQDFIKTGLHFPQGLAVDSYRKRLYVADPELNKVVYYDIVQKGANTLNVGDQHVVATNVEARWLSVDGVGHLYFSDERNNKILRVTAQRMMKGMTTPEIVYSNATVSAPGGVAADNFYVYWVNKDNGLDVGSLVQGHYWSNQINVHSKINSKSYGVCVGMGPIFYTASTTHLYAVTRDGGEVIQVSSVFQQPRGCAHDGESTLYVADPSTNAVHSLHSGSKPVEDTAVTNAYTYAGAYGLAIFTR